MDRGILLLGRTGSTNRPRPLPVCLSTPPSRSALRGADSQTASASAAGRSLHSVNKRVWQLCGRAREGGGVVADLFGSAVVQMVERPWGITAFGAASVKAVPDLIRVRFKIVRVEQAPATAFEAARDAVRAVRGVLRQHGIGDAAVEGSRLDLKTATEYVDGSRKFVGYQCQAAFAVESGALDDVEPLLVDVVAAGANEIEGVDFDVIAKRELRAEARRKAVAAARAKADLYAEAAGVRVGAILHVEDVDPEQPGTSRHHCPGPRPRPHRRVRRRDHRLRLGSPTFLVYRNLKEDSGYDYHLHHPGWAKPVLLATVEGHYLGPGLCWDELLAVSRSGAITGATLSAEGQMLLLLPIMADTDLARADNVVRPWSRPVWSSRRDLVLVNLQRTSDR